MLKLLSFSAVAALALATTAFAADSSATPPMAKNGMFVDAKGMTLYTFDKDGLRLCRDGDGEPRRTAADRRGDLQGAVAEGVSFLPSEAGEVSASYADGGVMGSHAVAHDPSAPFAVSAKGRNH